MTKLAKISLRDFQRGIVQPISHVIAPQNSVYFSSNFEFDTKIGSAKIREGIARLGAQIVNNSTVLGVHQFITTGGTDVLIAVVNDAASPTNSDFYTSPDAGANWTKETDTDIATWTKNTKTHFLTYLDTVLAYNGTLPAVSSANGTTWAKAPGTDTLDVEHFPLGDTAIEWNDKIYVSGVTSYKNRLYYSSVPSAGAITWDGEYIDIEPEDGGGDITALAKVPGYLLIFKERSLKRWNGSSTFPDDLFRVGAASMEGVTECRGIAYFFAGNGKGIYITNGGRPQKISRPVQDIIDAIPSAYYDDVNSHSDGDNVYFAIGDITLDGLTYGNCVLKYSVDSQTWSLQSYPAKEPQMWLSLKVSGVTYSAFGDDDGELVVIDSGTQDGSTVIEYVFQTHEIELVDTIQDITGIVVHTRNAKSAKVLARVDGGDWKTIGYIKNDNQEIECHLRGTRFEFRISGTSISGEVEVSGLTFTDVDSTTNYE